MIIQYTINSLDMYSERTLHVLCELLCWCCYTYTCFRRSIPTNHQLLLSHILTQEGSELSIYRYFIGPFWKNWHSYLWKLSAWTTLSDLSESIQEEWSHTKTNFELIMEISDPLRAMVEHDDQDDLFKSSFKGTAGVIKITSQNKNEAEQENSQGNF